MGYLGRENGKGLQALMLENDIWALKELASFYLPVHGKINVCVDCFVIMLNYLF